MEDPPVNHTAIIPFLSNCGPEESKGRSEQPTKGVMPSDPIQQQCVLVSPQRTFAKYYQVECEETEGTRAPQPCTGKR